MMRNTNSFAILIWVVLISAFAAFAPAQSSEEAQGQAAEQAGKLREALTHSVAALRSASEGGREDQRLRERIIKLVLKLDPPPAVPEEARGFFVRANTALKEAKGQTDYDSAIEKYKQALRLAPWWSDAYFNLASAYEAEGNFSAAIGTLKLYLVGAPAGGPDARQAQDKIYALQEKRSWPNEPRRRQTSSDGWRKSGDALKQKHGMHTSAIWAFLPGAGVARVRSTLS